MRRGGACQATADSGAAADEEPAVCALASVSARQEADATVLHVEAADFPGLLRTLAWVLEGLALRVVGADLTTGPDGIAVDEFRVVTEAGKPVADPELLASRVEDWLASCAPAPADRTATALELGGVRIKAADGESVVTVPSSVHKGQLFELASSVTALGISIRSASIVCASGCDWVLHVVGADGALNYTQASGLLYLLGVQSGATASAPLAPPSVA